MATPQAQRARDEYLRESARLGDHTHVGVSPAGIVYNVYRRPGESELDHEHRVAGAKRGLQRQWDKFNARHVRVPRLSGNAVFLIEDELELARGSGDAQTVEAAESAVIGRSYVQAPRWLLADIAESLEIREDDIAEGAAEGVFSDRPEQADFAERQARRGVRTTVARLRDAIAGKKPRRRVRL